MWISIAMNAAGGQAPSQDEGSEGNMPRDSTPGMLFLHLGGCKTQ